MTSLLYQQKLFGQDHAIIPELEQVIARPWELAIRDRDEGAVDAAWVRTESVFLRARRPTGAPRVVFDEHNLRFPFPAAIGRRRKTVTFGIRIGRSFLVERNLWINPIKSHFRGLSGWRRASSHTII